MTKNRQLYTLFCEQEQLPIFFQPWWLDVTVGATNWDVALHFDKQNEIIAVLPFVVKKKLGFPLLSHPKLTPHLGPWIKPNPDQLKSSRKFDQEIKYYKSLIQQLPNTFYTNFNCLPTVANALPFYWSGYDVSTLYTYQLSLELSVQQLYTQLKGSVRTEIKSAAGHLQWRQVENLNEIWHLQELTYMNQGVEHPFDLNFFKKVDEAVVQQADRLLVGLKNKSGDWVAFSYFLIDGQTAYLLLTGRASKIDKGNAISYLLWESIKYLKEKVTVLDFEGSMNQGIEKRYRSFGGKQIPYFKLSKSKNKLIALGIDLLKTLLK